MRIRRHYIPYIFIGVLALSGAILVYFMIPHLPWYLYVAGFFTRFIFMSAIWQVIVFVNKRLEKRYTFEEKPAIQIILQVLVTLLLFSPVFIVSIITFRPYSPIAFNESNVVTIVSAMYVIVIIMMVFGYYTYDLFIKHKAASKEKSRLQVEAAELEKDKSLMRYHHLKNQVNPHFLFNTLTSLEALIHSEPELAAEFVRHLAKVYRYVLEHKENEVVSLETELNFIRHYISLLQIRYKSAISVNVDITREGLEKGIAMVTLQMLIDNAIKHNSIQPDQPLQIRIWDEADSVHIQNKKQERRQIAPSGQQGLAQLRELYSYLTDRPVEIRDKNGSFEVVLPLI